MNLFKRALYVLLLLALVTGVGFFAKRQVQAASVDLQIAVTVSPDNGQTWVDTSTTPVCVKPGATILYRTDVWNEGDLTARQIHGDGEITNGNYIQTVAPTNIDGDGDGYGYTSYFCEPANNDGYLSWAPGNTDKNNAQEMTARMVLSNDIPCDTTIICREVLKTYDTSTYGDGQGQEGNLRPFDFVKKAYASLQQTDRIATLQVTVNADTCPKKCVGGSSISTLPQTGGNLMDLANKLF
jgi:hypothetical protein